MGESIRANGNNSRSSTVPATSEPSVRSWCSSRHLMRRLPLPEPTKAATEVEVRGCGLERAPCHGATPTTRADASEINLLQLASNCSEQHGSGTAVSIFVLTSHSIPQSTGRTWAAFVRPLTWGRRWGSYRGGMLATTPADRFLL